jgi:hypothetical protein
MCCTVKNTVINVKYFGFVFKSTYLDIKNMLWNWNGDCWFLSGVRELITLS